MQLISSACNRYLSMSSTTIAKIDNHQTPNIFNGVSHTIIKPLLIPKPNMNISRPTTPTNQPTKPASTNAPERPTKIKLTIETPKIKHTCQGCIEEQFNQMAHVGPGGCLEEDAFNIKYSTNYYTNDHTKEDNKDTDNTYQCPSYVEEWGGDCDTLSCGCIDVCRGRCGLREDDD